MAEQITTIIEVLPNFLTLASNLIAWAITTFPINLALVAMVAGTATGLVKKARKDMIGK